MSNSDVKVRVVLVFSKENNNKLLSNFNRNCD